MAEENELVAVPPNGSELSEGSEFADRSIAESQLQFCVFRAGRERFCLKVLEVEEVVDWPPVTRIPLAPPFLMGVFNLRGSIIPIIDVAVTEGRRPGSSPRSVVVASLSKDSQAEEIRIGIAADEVVGTYEAEKASLLRHAPHDLPHCRGMLQHEDRLALIVDLERLIQCFPISEI